MQGSQFKPHLPSVPDLVLGDALRLLEDPICDVFGRRAAVRHVVLDAKVVIRTARIVARGQENTTISFILADDIRSCRGREDTVSANDQLLDLIGGSNLENLLDGGLRIVPTIATYDNGGPLRRGSIEDSLDKVLSVVLLSLRSMCGAGMINALVVIHKTNHLPRTSCWKTLTLGHDRRVNTRPRSDPLSVPFPETRSTGFLVTVTRSSDDINVGLGHAENGGEARGKRLGTNVDHLWRKYHCRPPTADLKSSDNNKSSAKGCVGQLFTEHKRANSESGRSRSGGTSHKEIDGRSISAYETETNIQTIEPGDTNAVCCRPAPIDLPWYYRTIIGKLASVQ
jgi:hypothetical protein